MKNDLTIIDGFEMNSKRVVYRALANSAVFRLFNLVDVLHSMHRASEQDFDPKLDPAEDLKKMDELRNKAERLRKIYWTCSSILTELGGGRFWLPMDGGTVLEVAQRPSTKELDKKALALLVDLTGFSEEDLLRIRGQALIEQARKGEAKVNRVGDMFLNFLEHDTIPHDELLDTHLDEVQMDLNEIGIKALKKAMDKALRDALLGMSEGTSDLFFYKDAVLALS